MHNHYFVFRQVTPQLREKTKNMALVSCFSQEKDEVVLEFNDGDMSFFIKATLTSEFSCLSFPSTFNRARKNSAEIFNSVILKNVVGVRQYENERSFAIELEDGFALLFKMHGHQSNILLTENNVVTQIFKSNLPADLTLKPDSLDRFIDWSEENFLTHSDQAQKIFFTLGKPVWRYLEMLGWASLTIPEKWKLLITTKALLEKPHYHVIESNNDLHFSLLPWGKVVKTLTDPLEALTEFSTLYQTSRVFNREKQSTMRRLKDQADQTAAYLTRTKAKLTDLEQDQHYQQWADLLMANLHLIQPGQDKVMLNDFYENGFVEIKLRKEWTAQKNAEIFYRKGKNQRIEIEKLKTLIADKEKAQEITEEKISLLDGISDLRDWRKNKNVINTQEEQKADAVRLPYREFIFNGFTIRIGKDAKTNDELTLKSFKEDLWLHARDVTGSHVIIKHQAGKAFPKEVIERAASLAAFYSKRKTESLCPVIVTPKKFVRKRKGSPAGAVVVEREEVLMVEPKGL